VIFNKIFVLGSMSLKEKMDKLKRVLSGQDDDDEQNIVTQASANRLKRGLMSVPPVTSFILRSWSV